MIVEQIWTGNAYRNFNYLIACPETGETLAIDPLDFRKCLDVAKERGWNITQILNTHEHGDHTGGNKGVVNATGAKVIAHRNAGNCHNGGHPEELFETFESQMETLGDNTLIYPGHDYLLNNLAFTLDREPGNAVAQQMANDYRDQDPDDALVTTMAQEKDINTFFRLQSPGVVQKLAEDFPEMGSNPDPRAVFLKLRELRNSW